jgi:hypothetical protein
MTYRQLDVGYARRSIACLVAISCSSRIFTPSPPSQISGWRLADPRPLQPSNPSMCRTLLIAPLTHSTPASVSFPIWFRSNAWSPSGLNTPPSHPGLHIEERQGRTIDPPDPRHVGVIFFRLHLDFLHLPRLPCLAVSQLSASGTCGLPELPSIATTNRLLLLRPTRSPR